MKFWDQYSSWDKAEKDWDKGSLRAQKLKPLKTVKHSPKTPSITAKTARFLKLKSLIYIIANDKTKAITKYALRNLLACLHLVIKPLFQKKTCYFQEDNLFFYNIHDIEEFQEKLFQDNILVMGFSYCHRPLECPAQRFSSRCLHNPDNAVCRQCFIGKCLNALPEKQVVPILITTTHHIAEKVINIVEKNKNKEVLFIITACELALKMFSDWHGILKIKGLGVKLGGRTCNTIKAFKLAENGIKPTLTSVSESLQNQVLALIRCRREAK